MKQSSGRVLIAGGITLLMLSGALGWWLKTLWSEPATDKVTSDPMQASGQLSLRIRSELDEFESSYSSIELANMYMDEPLNIATLDLLSRAEVRFTQFVDPDSEVPLSNDLAARGHQNLARIATGQGRWRDVIDHYEAARKRFRQIPAAEFTELLAGQLAVVESRLSTAQAMIGELAPASETASSAVQRLQQTRTVFSDDANVAYEHAIALRNQSVLQLLTGRDGLPTLIRAVDATRELSLRAQVPVDRIDAGEQVGQMILLNELHIDTLQFAMAVLQQADRLTEAETLCLESLELLETLQLRIPEYSAKTGLQLPLLKYRSAIRMARNNLDQLRDVPVATSLSESAMVPAASDSPLPSDWRWRPLNMICGHSVSFERLGRARLAGEFEPQEGLMLSWLDADWTRLAAQKIIAATWNRLQVYVLVGDDMLEDDARTSLREIGLPDGAVQFIRAKSDTFWIRDFGPLVVDTSAANWKLLDAEYQPDTRPRDNHIPRQLSQTFAQPILPAPIILEGGAILYNGAGLCLASSTLLSMNAEYGYPEQHVTATLKRVTGAKQVIYLEPLVGEPTSHVDWFAAFTSADTLVLGDYGDRDPENAALLNRHAERLHQARTDAGPLNVVRIPMPPRARDYFGGTYTNVVFANGVLLVPTWPEAPLSMQQQAFEIYRRLLPGWEIRGIESRSLAMWSGGPHCATINLHRIPQPKALPEKPVRSTPPASAAGIDGGA